MQKETPKLEFGKMVIEHFANRPHEMRETRNNCFESKIHNTILRQTKRGKHALCYIWATSQSPS